MEHSHNLGSNEPQQQHSEPLGSMEETRVDNQCADLALFWLQLTQSICSGRQLLPSLRDIQAQLDAGLLAEVVDRICEDIQNGHTLSQSMQLHPHIFGKHVLCLVEGGERAGILDRVLLLILEYSWRCPQCILGAAQSTERECDSISAGVAIDGASNSQSNSG